MSVILYSTHCPQCMVLEKILKDNGIIYEEVNDVDMMKNKGLKSVPKLEVDDKIMDMKEAMNWIKEKSNNE